MIISFNLFYSRQKADHIAYEAGWQFQLPRICSFSAVSGRSIPWSSRRQRAKNLSEVHRAWGLVGCDV